MVRLIHRLAITKGFKNTIIGPMTLAIIYQSKQPFN